ncbi:cyclic nucleotide-binding domain-containing protein [Aureimonas populi]|uniref:Cyclic nucleotide-binding domain-containing protein n=1 Tax=Aureimonas populi TaxID=1701758 RepID=A0ABW5CHQ2_9HYPH|nr:cyclic nucleotide-binding domain-containing protein [Aureimonas populi]
MSLESDMEVLGQVPLFAALSRDQLRLLAFGAEKRHLREGETLYRADARADAGFVVVTGEVRLMQGPAGRERVAAVAGPGALLGELALITETRRGATAITAQDSHIIRIPRALFRRMLEEFPEIAAGLREEIAAGFSEMTRRIGAMENRFRD